MSSDRWIKCLALVQLSAALPWHGVYLFGWHARGMTGFDAWAAFLAIEGVIFLALPLVSVLGAFSNRRWTYYSLMAFPILAFVHGISALPYLSHLAPVGYVRSAILALINGGMVYFVNRLRLSSVARYA
jgi:hypothetical protein